jgi:ketosteroid isomerase-like protein
VSKDNPNLPKPDPDEDETQDQDRDKDQPVPSPEIEDFFQRLPGSFRRPKPNAEAVAAAVEAVNRLSGGAIPTGLAAADAADERGKTCSACGGSLPAGARFCVWCGIPSAAATGEAQTGQHHFHHHYHHFVPGAAAAGQATTSAAPGAEAEPSGPRGKAPIPATPGSAPPAAVGRAEASARQVVQDWAQACNIRHIDDLLELYASDATVIRSNVPPVRSLPAIREFLASLLEAGLGDVEMESMRLEMMGEIAMDLGRCRMLVPLAMGKRREERGKYLVVLVRQAAGNWKILADCWSSDQSVSTPPEGMRKGSEPVPPVRKPR